MGVTTATDERDAVGDTAVVADEETHAKPLPHAAYEQGALRSHGHGGWQPQRLP